MSEETTKETPRQPSAGFIQLILSSSLAAAVIALLGTLTGLMFRTGWLEAYGITTELFMPESATELAYWGFFAVVVTWSNTWNWLGASITLIAGTAFLYTAVIVVGAKVSFWVEKNKDAIKTRVLSARGTRKRLAAISGVAFLGIAIAPWALMIIPALGIAVPLLGHSAGKSVAEKGRRHYEAQLKDNKFICHGLSGASGSIGRCPMVIAQSKDRIAYMDGDRVHVIPSQGVSVSWTPRQLPSKDK